MARGQSKAAGRTRVRRGTLERPINGRVYRGGFVLVVPAFLLLAFSVTRPVALPKPSLPEAFDAEAALSATRELSTDYPNRVPGTAGSQGAANWFRLQLQGYGLKTTTTTWVESIPGLGKVPLANITAVAPGLSPNVIVVMAHRDDTGVGPGANDNASGTAVLIELARAYAQPQRESQTFVRSPHTLVFLSTDGGAFGGVGAAHFIETTAFRKRIFAVINLDALAGHGAPGLVFAGDTPRSPNADLVATAVARIAEQTGTPPRHITVAGQLIDLAFPLTFYEQGPFVGAGIPAITLTSNGNRSPAAFTDTPGNLQGTRLGQLGSAAQQLLGSVNEGLSLHTSPASYIWVGGRIVRGWAIDVVLIALIFPVAFVGVDLYALCRRNGISLAPAGRALLDRFVFFLVAGIVFTCFSLFGAWPRGSGRPLAPDTTVANRWPVFPMIAIAVLLLAVWRLAHRRGAPPPKPSPADVLAGETCAIAGLVVVALMIASTNPAALLFAVPALHTWVWIPQIWRRGLVPRLAVFLIGLLPPLVLLVSIALRFGLGFDAPLYLLDLVSVGYIPTTAVVVSLTALAGISLLGGLVVGTFRPDPLPMGQRYEQVGRDVLRSANQIAVGRRSRRSPRDV